MPAQFSWDKGFYQRANRNLYEPGELLDAVNVIPDPEGGGIATRAGDFLLGTVGASVHSLYATTSPAAPVLIYQGAGSVLYRNFIPIITGLTGARLSFAQLQGFGDRQVHTFFAGGQDALRVKDTGTVLSGWGMKQPSLALGASSSASGGGLVGAYAWKQVYVRKPVIPGLVFGRWINAAPSYTLTGTFPWPLTDGLAANNGTVFAAPERWDEIVVGLQTGTGSTGGSLEYSYWNGLTWTTWLTAPFGIYSASMTSFKNSFAFDAWTALNGLYLLRIRVLVNPPINPHLTSTVAYDGVYTARSNPSPAGVVSAPYGPGPLTGTATVFFSNPIGAPDFESQATHVALYRTTGDDAAATTNGVVAGDAALYFFERDYPAGATTHLSSAVDVFLGELIEIDNDRPPIFDTITEYQERIFGARGNRLFFSKRGFPDAFPGTNFLDVGSLAAPIQRIAQFHGQLYIWTKARIYLLLGDSEASYDTRLVQCPTGLGAVQSVAEGERAIYFVGNDGHLWALQGTIAANVSRLGHQQLFEGVTLHGVAGINLAGLSACVGHWGKGRYHLSYPVAPATVPSTSLMIDEARGSWWRDTRAWQSLFYNPQTNIFYGGLADGKVVILDSGFTDHGAAITGTVQTLDDDAGLQDGDKALSQLTVELQTSATGLTITPVVGYVLAGTPLGTLTSLSPNQLILPTPAPGMFRGLTLGYRLVGVAPWALYGFIPHVLRLPVRLRTWQTLATTLGWPGPKILDSVLLDVEVASGVFTWQLFGDDVLVESGTITTLGHTVPQLLTQRHEATVFILAFQGTGVFFLHEGSTLSWRPLPPPIYTDIMVPTDLGTLQDKVGLAFSLDIDLLAPGVVTTTFYADGALIHTFIYSTVGRLRTERLRLPAAMHGRLLEIRRQSTAPYRLWPGTDFTYQVVGNSQEQHFRPVSQEYGSEQKTSMLQLPHTQEG